MQLKKKILSSFIFNEIVSCLRWNKFKPLNCTPHGHFYSPIVSKDELDCFENQIWGDGKSDSVLGINLNVDSQLNLLGIFSSYYPDLPFGDFKTDQTRYYFNNDSFGYTDAILLYSFIRHFRPKKIVEIGSGFSSAVMLDTREIFCNDMDLVFVEPFPDLLYSLFRKDDRDKCVVFDTKVQNVGLDTFRSLHKNDILFIDSSHVSKAGSDVNFELFKILPLLESGVVIHFHDVFFPFEYPKEWVYKGKNWNEDYLLRAFLSYNDKFEILLFADYMHKYHGESFKQMPLTSENTGGSLWVRKL